MKKEGKKEEADLREKGFRGRKEGKSTYSEEKSD